MRSKGELVAAEGAGWSELHAILDSLSVDHLERPAFADESTVKDLMAHIGGWQAKTVQILEQIRFGTYRTLEHDVEELNEVIRRGNLDQPARVVWCEMNAARNRMLQEWRDLPEVTPVAEEWFVESGPEHYREHLGPLRRWAAARS